MRRPPISAIRVAAILSVVLVLLATWQRSSARLGAAVAWLSGLTILWIGASIADPRSQPGVTRDPVGPPLSPEAEWVALLGVCVVAIAFRFVLLADVPPFISNDESMFSFEKGWRPDHPDLYGLSLLESWPRGWCPYLFGVGWNAFPTLSFVVHWLPMMVLGVSNWSLRFGCAVIGTLSILVLYLWVRRWWGNLVAVSAALSLSINIEHVYWSRLALNNIDAALVGAWALAALAWALDTRSWRAWVSLGYALGFGFHTYHGAKLHAVLAAFVLLVLALGRIERFSRLDRPGLLLAALAAALVATPLVPDLVPHGAGWIGDYAGRLDVDALFSALWRGDVATARAYVEAHYADTARLFRPAPVMGSLFLSGSAIALWQWKDPRYLTAVLWMSAILLVGSATVGWRSARLIGAMPVVSLMPALAIGHIRAVLLRWAPATARRVLAACVLVVLLVALYEAWWVEFVWRAQFRNTTFGLCRAIQRLPLPATIYVAGKGEPFGPEAALHICTIPDDPHRRFVTIPPDTHTLSDIGNDPNVLAIIFADRLDVLTEIRQSHPAAIEEPFLLNGSDPYAGRVPGAAPGSPGTVAFYVVRLRSSCPATPLLQTHNPC